MIETIVEALLTEREIAFWVDPKLKVHALSDDPRKPDSNHNGWMQINNKKSRLKALQSGWATGAEWQNNLIIAGLGKITRDQAVEIVRQAKKKIPNANWNRIKIVHVADQYKIPCDEC